MTAHSSSTTHPALFGTTLLVLAALAAPAAAQTIGGDRARLNVVPQSNVVVGSATPAGPSIDGERALLARTSPTPSAVVGVATRWVAEPAALTGERALLGTVDQPSRRRLTLAW